METENLQVEFKQIWKDDFLKNICAFANSEGGLLFVGVRDNGEIVGVENSSRLLEILPNLINQKLGIIASVACVIKEGKPIIVITSTIASVPISYNGHYYIRSGSVVLELEGRELSDFLLRKNGITWDAFDNYPFLPFEPSEQSIESFKTLAFDRLPFAKLEHDTLQLLNKLQLLTPALRPTNAAILLFDTNPQRFFSQAVVKIGRFINDSDIVSSDIVGGNLFHQAENVLEILKTKYLLSPITYEGIHRREILQYPYEALREAIFNALIHRDYNTTSSILIKIYSNRLSISNEGQLPPEISIEDLKHEHLSKPRNKLLADVFYKAGFIESWGRGTLKIIDECRKARIPEPEFLQEKGVVTIVFKLAVIENEGLNEGLKEGLNEGLKSLLQIICENPNIQAKDLGVLLNNRPLKTIERQLKSLTQLQFIKRIGSKKTGGYVALLRD